jgi:hypothetical protein
MARPVFNASLLDGLRRDMMHSRDVRAALADLQKAFEREEIPFAVIGALAMRQHGYVRHTEDIDIVTTPEGLARIHERLMGRGLVARARGSRKKLRETTHQVDLDVLQAGEHAGAPGSPVRYPAPTDPQFATGPDGIRYATLPALLSFKIAAGIWGKRPRDLARTTRTGCQSPCGGSSSSSCAPPGRSGTSSRRVYSGFTTSTDAILPSGSWIRFASPATTIRRRSGWTCSFATAWRSRGVARR